MRSRVIPDHEVWTFVVFLVFLAAPACELSCRLRKSCEPASCCINRAATCELVIPSAGLELGGPAGPLISEGCLYRHRDCLILLLPCKQIAPPSPSRLMNFFFSFGGCRRRRSSYRILQHSFLFRTNISRKRRPLAPSGCGLSNRDQPPREHPP